MNESFTPKGGFTVKTESKEQLAKDLTSALEDVRGERDRLKWEVQWLEGVLQQLQHDPYPYPGEYPGVMSQQQPTESSGGESGNGQVSDERMQRILAALEEPSTARELHQRTGIPQSTVSSALTRMHKQGLVRKTGVRKQKAGLSPALWALPWESPS